MEITRKEDSVSVRNAQCWTSNISSAATTKNIWYQTWPGWLWEQTQWADKLATLHNTLTTDSGGKLRLGLLLETVRAVDGTFPVTQAVPSKLTKAGVRGPILGCWKFVNKRWEETENPPKRACRK